jgi:hypothetical protein
MSRAKLRVSTVRFVCVRISILCIDLSMSTNAHDALATLD